MEAELYIDWTSDKSGIGYNNDGEILASIELVSGLWVVAPGYHRPKYDTRFEAAANVAGAVVVLIAVVAIVAAATRPDTVAGTAPAPTGSVGKATLAPAPLARTQRGADYLARTQQLGVPDQLAAAMGVSACQSVAAGLSRSEIVEMTASAFADDEQRMGTQVPLGVEPDLVVVALTVLCPDSASR